MRYMALIYGPPAPVGIEYPPEALEAWMDYTTAAEAAGICIDSNELAPPATATTVTMRDGKRVLSDGPFAETKEVLGGYYLFDCENIDQAVEWAAKCPALAMGGTMEVRPVVAR